MSTLINEFSLNSQIKELKEYRCPKCSTIPFFIISANENKLFISAKCTNNHFYSDKPFDEMKKMCIEYLIKNFVCATCESEKTKEKKCDINYYCPTCFKFFCFEHGKSHDLKDEHKTFQFNENFNNVCYEHKGNSIIGYCFNHNKNYCIKCLHFNENNKKVDEELTDNEINKYENNNKNNEKIIEQLDN